MFDEEDLPFDLSSPERSLLNSTSERLDLSPTTSPSSSPAQKRRMYRIHFQHVNQTSPVEVDDLQEPELLEKQPDDHYSDSSFLFCASSSQQEGNNSDGKSESAESHQWGDADSNSSYSSESIGNLPENSEDELDCLSDDPNDSSISYCDLYEGAQVSTDEAVLSVMDLLIKDSNTSLKGLSNILSTMQKILTQQNKLPKTLYMLFKYLKQKIPDDYMVITMPD